MRKVSAPPRTADLARITRLLPLLKRGKSSLAVIVTHYLCIEQWQDSGTQLAAQCGSFACRAGSA